uniref:De novo protein n=2 Tax=Escherichia coli TaxID=562 RepID=UPI003704D524
MTKPDFTGARERFLAGDVTIVLLIAESHDAPYRLANPEDPEADLSDEQLERALAAYLTLVETLFPELYAEMKAALAAAKTPEEKIAVFREYNARFLAEFDALIDQAFARLKADSLTLKIHLSQGKGSYEIIFPPEVQADPERAAAIEALWKPTLDQLLAVLQEKHKGKPATTVTYEISAETLRAAVAALARAAEAALRRKVGSLESSGLEVLFQ